MRTRLLGWCVAALTTVAFTLLTAGHAHAATPHTLYSYTLTGASATVPNDAATLTGVNLNLVGDWSASAFGVHFAGDTVNQQSVGWAKPTGSTINAAATKSVGVGIKIRYEGPTSGSCFTDSANLTQIGRFSATDSQVKLQLTNCGNSTTAVYPACRMAGDNSSTSDLPKRGTLALVDGEDYVVKCYKNPDPASGSGTLTLVTTHLDAVNGNTTVTDTFAITRPGLIKTSAYLSVANKYALPPVTANTDQFTGDVAKVSYCQSSSTANVSTCLDTELPT